MAELGSTVAAVVARESEEPEASELSRAIRECFARRDDELALAELTRLQDAPESLARGQAFEAIVDSRAAANAGLRSELEQILERASRSVRQTSIGNQNVQLANISGSSISVSYGRRGPDR